jgi:hypothetical protein
LELMNSNHLIYYWKENNEWYIQFCKWEDYQSIRKDRLELSKLPSFNSKDDNQLSTKCQPDDNQTPAQANTSKSNVVEVNKSEDKVEQFAVKNTYKENSSGFTNILDPKQYQPKNAGEVAAKDAWLKLEPNNSRAFYTTYLQATHDGLPPSYFYTFVSEIKQSNADKPGAVFNSKVKSYFERKKASTNS